VSKVATISKLEALLSRIRSRAAEPRSARSPAVPAHAPAASPAAVAAPAAVAPAMPVVSPAAVAPPAAVASPVPVAPPAAVSPAFAPPTVPAFVPSGAPVFRAARESTPAPPEWTQLDEPTLPPPPLAEAAGDADFDVDVDVPSGTPVPPAVAPSSEAQDPTDSRERLSAAPTTSLESVESDSIDTGPSIEQVEEVNELANEVNEGGIASEEGEAIVEAPASSRRPVTSPPEERLAELAFGAEEEQPPRHTPPPKSGPLPAPPDLEFDADVTGVHATPGISKGEAPAPSVPSPEPSVLAAQAVRADLGSGASAQVPDVIGDAQRFAPATFLALLDASLSL
jgi:hypothetical protein